VRPPVAAAPFALTEPTPTPPVYAGLWHFEWLSSDGKRALLRQLDASPFHAIVVDVDSGAAVEEVVLGELAKLPATTIGRRTADRARLEALLAEPAFGEDLARAAEVTGPFASCGRLSAKGGAIAFNAGDWLYLTRGEQRTRLADVAAYDPRFTPDGAHLVFRRAGGKIDAIHARYELAVVPADLSGPARALAGTAGVQETLVVDEDRGALVAIASHEPQIKTCVISARLKAPFAVKRLACLEGKEKLVEAVLSPRGRWAAMTTTNGPASFRLRVASLDTGTIPLDEPAALGMNVRAISDGGVLAMSRDEDALIIDVPARTRRSRTADLGHRAFFRGEHEIVYVRGGSVAVLDLLPQLAAR
jgi:hypothetical protein